MPLRTIVLIWFVLQINARLWSASYYLSENGKDSNRGTVLTEPWQTLAPLSKILPNLAPGDSILFERGSTFRGNLEIFRSGTKEKSIYIGAYGSGRNPVIKGSILLSDWTVYKKNIWVTDCQTCKPLLCQFFINGSSQPLGRFPDIGYRSLQAYQSKNSFTDSTLSFPDDYWKNAEVVVKSSRWTIDKLPVSDFHKNEFTSITSPSYSLESGLGYFIQNHINTLNRNGEWYFDPSSQKLYLYFDDPLTIKNLKTEVAIYTDGLIMNKTRFVRIENLEFNQFTGTGIQIKDSDYISIEAITIKNTTNGLEISECKNPIVKNNRIENSSNNGVEWKNNDKGEFTGNEITKTGMVAGQGKSGNGTYISLLINGESPHSENLFINNRIDSTGYIGIDFRTGGNVIKNNLVQNFCLIKDDSAGIYTWGNHYGNNIIEENIILNGKGNGEGTLYPAFRHANGIYIDDNSSNITMKDNTIAYCSQSGIFIHNSDSLKICHNTLFGNGDHFANKEKSQLYIRQDEIVKHKTLTALEITRNKLFATNENSYCVYWSTSEKENYNQFKNFYINQYFAPNSNQVFAYSYKEEQMCDAPKGYSLNEWQGVSQQDEHSTFKFLPSSYRSTRTLLAPKSNKEWMIWPEGSKIQSSNKPENYIEVIPPNQSEVLLYQSNITVKKNSTYRLTFMARSNTHGTVEFVPLMANSPWAALGDYTCFSLEPVFKKFTYLFQVSTDYAEARLNFKTNQQWQIKNVQLEEVVRDPQSVKLISNSSPKSKYVKLNGLSFPDSDKTPSAITLDAYTSAIVVKK